MIEFEKIYEIYQAASKARDYATVLYAMDNDNMSCSAKAMKEWFQEYDECCKELKKLIEEN